MKIQDFELIVIGSPNAVVLLEGRRGISEADTMAARDFGEFLARRFPALRFRSGNAEGADQAFSDGVRQRAATIPGKRKPGPGKDEFDTDKLSSGRLYFPSELRRNKVGRDLEDNVKIKFGRMSENNDRTPDGKWMLDASKLKQLLRDEDGKKLSNEESAKFLGISMRELEKMLQDGSGISESDAYTFIDQAFTGGSNPAAVAEIIEAIWGFDSAPYWYDRRRGNLLTRAEYGDYIDEGIDMDGELVPRDFDAVEKVVASEISKNLFPVSALSESLGVESDEDLTRAITFEVDGEQISPTAMQLKKWKKEGVPTAIIEQLVDRGIIPSAGDVFGEEGSGVKSNLAYWLLGFIIAPEYEPLVYPEPVYLRIKLTF
jgi:hypothetical protein